MKEIAMLWAALSAAAIVIIGAVAPAVMPAGTPPDVVQQEVLRACAAASMWMLPVALLLRAGRRGE